MTMMGQPHFFSASLTKRAASSSGQLRSVRLANGESRKNGSPFFKPICSSSCDTCPHSASVGRPMSGRVISPSNVMPRASEKTFALVSAA